MGTTRPPHSHKRLLAVLTLATLLGVGITTFPTGPAAAESGFAIEITGTNSAIIEGDTLEVTATVAYQGADRHTETVALRVGGVERDATEVTLTGGETRTVTLTWATGEGDAGNYTAQVATPNDTAETDVTVEEPSTFDPDVEDTNSPVAAGEDLVVRATVENTGDVPATKTVTLAVAGAERDTTRVTLDAGEIRAVTLTWATGEGDAGNYTAQVATPNDTAETDVTVEEPGHFDATVEDTNSPVAVGEDLVVRATVTNTGAHPTTQTVTLTVAGEPRDTTRVTLDAGETRTVTLTWATGDGDAGNYSAAIATPNDTAETDVTVGEPWKDDAQPTTTSPDPGMGFPIETVALGAAATAGVAAVVVLVLRRP